MSNHIVWCITDAKINELQAASIDRLIARAGAAHFTDIRLRINGEFEHFEADWLKHLRRVTDPQRFDQLMRFYAARTLEELIERQDHHIKKLQEKLPPVVDEFQRTPRGG